MPIVLKSGSLNLLEPSGPLQACNGIVVYVYRPVDIKVELFGSKTVLANVCMSVDTFLTIIGG